MKKENKVLRNIAAILAVLACVIAAAILFIWKLDNVITNDIVQFLDGATQYGTDVFCDRLESDINRLQYAAEWTGKNYKTINNSKITDQLIEKMQGSHFSNLSIADHSGKIYNANSMRNANDDEKKLLNQIKNHQVLLSANSCFDETTDWISVVAPIDSQGKIIGSVIGYYSADDLHAMLRNSFYPFNNEIRIIRCNGDALQLFQEDSFQNAFTFLSKNGSNSTIISSKMQEGKSGSLLCNLNYKKTVINFIPIGINDWYLFFITPIQTIPFRSVHFLRSSVYFMLISASVLILVILAMLLCQQKNRQNLQRLKEELSVLYNTLPGGIICCKNDDKMTVHYASKGFYYFIGYTKQEFKALFHNQVLHLIHPDDHEKIKKNHCFLLSYGSVLADEYRIICAGGSVKWIWLNSKVSNDAIGEKSIYNTFADITPFKQAQENLLVNQRLYDIILNQTQDSIFEWNIIEQTVYFSKNFLKKFGYEPSSCDFPECAIQSNNIPKSDRDAFRKICRQLINGKKYVSGEFRIKKIDGSYLWCSITATAILDKDGKAYKAVGILSDIDTQKRTFQTVKEYAQKDSLTGLYNKGITESCIRTYIEQNKSPAALIVIDIDNFKQVNDTLGHLYGDTALKEIANAIKSLFRSTDIVGRIGGDEFIVFLEHIPDEFMVHKKVHKITEIFQHCFAETKVDYKMTVSVGIAFYPKHADNFPELFDKADIALYYAKNHGKNQYAVYCEKVEEANSLRSQKKNGLRLY